MYLRGYNGLGGCFGYGDGFFGPWMMMGSGVLLLVAVIIAAVILFKMASSKKRGDSSLELLKLRYAKGEISEAEYLKMKKVLSK
ncbi:SHOCT domain-containing protein [Sporolactobacillus vineae]|uniref:SHOCT domain-containing protein n=1 Tax=Sporolactobacillus vineae TaxID=444463 RepID=UPI000288E1DC|nr:SHOCT domain-containing protein [Sporolactobacillus vineae]